VAFDRVLPCHRQERRYKLAKKLSDEMKAAWKKLFETKKQPGVDGSEISRPITWDGETL